MTGSSNDSELRVLLKMVTARDGTMVMDVLQRAGIHSEICKDTADMADRLEEGIGALLIAEEVLVSPGFQRLAQALRSQPTWSDVPMIVLAKAGADSAEIGALMQEITSISILERPLRVPSLVSSVRTALRARRKQYQLRTTLTGLQEVDRRKNEFLATLAHELRNPLAPLRTSLAILSRSHPSAHEAIPIYAIMDRQVTHMVRLIDDLMEVSRITRGKIELKLETVDLDTIVSDAIELSRPLLETSGHQLEVMIAAGPWSIRGDFVRLTQVFANLLNNAAKYTADSGRISIDMRREAGIASVQISDNGMGIANSMLTAVFDMFVQVNDTARIAQGGLGIGLTLVKSLVELHGGSVKADSEGLGRGSSFTVELPLAEGTRADESPVSPSETRVGLAHRVLVVDDNHDVADTLFLLVKSLRADARVAYDGEQALSIAMEYLPSIAFVDIGMPGMDGYQLAARFRATPALGGMKIVALTGWGQKDDKQRIFQAGFDEHLVKPADVDLIEKVLASDRRSSSE
jgi:signal transduction histidine kinase/ActR/RegA family two-component response regulator